MAALFYKPENAVVTQSKAKAYFCCHPKDFDAYFEDVTKEILSKQSCIIFYRDKNDEEYDEDFFAHLLQMKLFIIPVTKNFLKKGNPTLEKEFRFAVENGITVLPLMQERGLENLFNEICGNIQFLDKHNADSTCLDYSDKLGKFLSSVFIGDELAEKIRDAFDAFVFLSYRKKDRRLAQELMNLIHKNDFCRDIAIWYDEFLVPGEDFNSAIEKAVINCDLFVLTVTQNIVNEPNYVIEKELPLAKDNNKKILACEMSDTDKDALIKKEIPECTNGRDNEAVAQALKGHFGDIAKNGLNNSPEHQFFIGLAYLNGIDVEIDRERGLALITAAADKDLPEAVEQLIHMYNNGDGVRIDRPKALFWRERLLEIKESIYNREKDFDSAFKYIRACFELASDCYTQNLWEKCIDCCKMLQYICCDIKGEIVCDRSALIHIDRHFALADMYLGQTYHALNDKTAAMEHFRLAETSFEKINRACDNHYFLSDTAALYRRIAQLYKVTAKPEKTLMYLEKALSIQKIITEKYSEEHLVEQVYTLQAMSEINRLLGYYKEARSVCLTALDIIDGLIKIYGLRNYIGYKLMILLELAEAYRMNGDFEMAIEIYNELPSLEKTYSDYFGERPFYVSALRLSKVSQISYQHGDFEAVIKYGTAALELLENPEVITSELLATGSSALAITYLFVAQAYLEAEGDKNSAYKYFKLAVKYAEKYLEDDILCNITDLIMIYSAYSQFMMDEKKISEAEEYLNKAIAINENYHAFNKDSTINYSVEATLYFVAGNMFFIKEKYSDALKVFHKAEAALDRIISFTPGIEGTLLNMLTKLYFLIAACYAIAENESGAEKYYTLCMSTYDRVPQERYIISDWNILGLCCLQLYEIKGLFKGFKWLKKAKKIVRTMKELYPSQYKDSSFYQIMKEIGPVD